MSIGSQHREVERFAFCCNLGQTVFGEGEEFFVLIAPPFVVVFRDQALLLCPVVIVDLVIAVLFEVVFTASEGADGTNEEVLLVAFIRKDISECVDLREEAFLVCHLISADAGVQRQTEVCAKIPPIVQVV